MSFKVCTKCKQEKETTQFFPAYKSRNKDKLQSHCKSCASESIAKSIKKKSKEIKQKLDEYKLCLGCTDCGYNAHPEALDFDHIQEKSFDIAYAKQRYSWEMIQEEIKKCEVVCANCHRIRTANRRISL